MLEIIVDWLASLWGLTDPERQGKKPGRVWTAFGVALMIAIFIYASL